MRRTLHLALGLSLAAASLAATDNSRLGVVDTSNNFIVAQEAVGSLGETVRVVKRAGATGALQWAQNVMIPTYAANYTPVRVRLDASNNVLVAGYYNDAANLLLPVFFVTKLSASTGAALWTQTYETGLMGQSKATDMAVDSTGASYIVGYNSDGLRTSTTGKILKYDSAGVLTNNLTVSPVSTDKTYLQAIEIDGSNRIYIAGNCENHPAAVPTVHSTYLSRLDRATMTFLWEQVETIAGVADYEPTLDTDVAVDTLGRPVASYGYSDLGASSYDVCVRKKTATAGALVWNQLVTGGSFSGESGLIVDSADDVLVGGANRLFGTNTRDGVRLAKVAGATGTVTWNTLFPYSTISGPPSTSGGGGGTCLMELSTGNYMSVCNFASGTSRRAVGCVFTAAGAFVSGQGFLTSPTLATSVVPNATGGYFMGASESGAGATLYPRQFFIPSTTSLPTWSIATP